MVEQIAQGTNALLFAQQNILLLQTPDQLWQFPGGTFEPDNDASLEDCCLREVHEETRLQLLRQSLARICSVTTVSVPRKPTHSPVFIDHYFYGATNIAPVELSDEHVDATWRSPQSALAMLNNSADRLALELCMRYRTLKPLHD